MNIHELRSKCHVISIRDPFCDLATAFNKWEKNRHSIMSNLYSVWSKFSNAKVMSETEMKMGRAVEIAMNDYRSFCCVYEFELRKVYNEYKLKQELTSMQQWDLINKECW